MQQVRRRVVLFGTAVLISQLGCGVEHSLERVSKSIEDYGTVSISGSTLIDPDPRFQFDLRLTGEQIFERNRIEGFSNVSQYEALDVEVSVKAEIMLNMLDQMQGVADPGLFQQMKQQLGAAAFQTVLGSAAAKNPALKPLADALQGIGKPKNTTGQGGGAGGADGGGGGASDGGRELANQAIDQAKSIQTTEDGVKKDGVKGDEALLQATGAVESADKLVALLDQAVGQAVALRNDVNSGVGQNVGAYADAAGAVKTADAKIADARKARDALAKKVEDAKKANSKDPKDLKDGEKLDLAKKMVDGMGATATEGANKAKDAADEAVKAARAFEDAGGKLKGAGGGGKQPLEAPPIDPNARVAMKKMSEFRPALPTYSGPMNLNLQQLIALSASDKMTLEMLRWLSYPNNYGPGKRIYLCMASVNVTPGRITQEDFEGSVDLMMRYATMEKPTLERDTSQKNCIACLETDRIPAQPKFFGTGYPIVFAAHPFINTQVLDLRYSRRESLTIAAQLILNGYPAAARVFLDYARQREQDVGTITGDNTLTSYCTGRSVGFTFSPQFVAQRDPAKIDTKPGHRLQPQTIPVMLMIICEDDQLKQMTKCCEGTKQKPGVVFIQSSNWRRTNKPTILSALFGPSRRTEISMYQRAKDLDDVYAHVRALREARCDQNGFFPPTSREEQYLATRMNAFTSQCIGENSFFTLPYFYAGTPAGGWSGGGGTPMIAAEKREPGALAPSADIHVSPLRGWLNRPSTFIIEADSNIFDSDFLVTIGSQRVNATRLSDTTLMVTIPPWLDTFDLETGQPPQKKPGNVEDGDSEKGFAYDGGAELAESLKDKTGTLSTAIGSAQQKEEANKALDLALECAARLQDAITQAGELCNAVNNGASKNVGTFGPAVGPPLHDAHAKLTAARDDLNALNAAISEARKRVDKITETNPDKLKAKIADALQGFGPGDKNKAEVARVSILTAANAAKVARNALLDLNGAPTLRHDRDEGARKGRNLWAQLVVMTGAKTLVSEPIYFDYYAPTQTSASNPNRPDVEIHPVTGKEKEESNGQK